MRCKNLDLIGQVVSEHMLGDRQVSTRSGSTRPTAIRWANRMTALSGSHGLLKKERSQQHLRLKLVPKAGFDLRPIEYP